MMHQREETLSIWNIILENLPVVNALCWILKGKFKTEVYVGKNELDGFVHV